MMWFSSSCYFSCYWSMKFGSHIIFHFLNFHFAFFFFSFFTIFFFFCFGSRIYFIPTSFVLPSSPLYPAHSPIHPLFLPSSFYLFFLHSSLSHPSSPPVTPHKAILVSLSYSLFSVSLAVVPPSLPLSPLCPFSSLLFPLRTPSFFVFPLQISVV